MTARTAHFRMQVSRTATPNGRENEKNEKGMVLDADGLGQRDSSQTSRGRIAKHCKHKPVGGTARGVPCSRPVEEMCVRTRPYQNSQIT